MPTTAKQVIVAGFGLALLLVASFATAQNNFSGVGGPTVHGGPTIHGVPPSVTSFGFGGGHGFHGVPPSVTSPNFGNLPYRIYPGVGFGHHHRGTAFVNPYYGYYGGYYAPYPYYVMDPGVDDSMETDYVPPSISARAEPEVRQTVRRELDSLKSDIEDYRAELRADAQRERARPQPEPDEQAIANQPKTVLVFKDGHQQEVANYAIVGDTLYNIADGRTTKVALASLDLPATVKQNDQRGLQFQVPVRTN